MNLFAKMESTILCIWTSLLELKDDSVRERSAQAMGPSAHDEACDKQHEPQSSELYQVYLAE